MQQPNKKNMCRSKPNRVHRLTHKSMITIKIVYSTSVLLRTENKKPVFSSSIGKYEPNWNLCLARNV